MSGDRKVKGIWVPIEIWEAENLSWNEKILLMEIDSYTAKDKDCFFSDEQIGLLLGIHPNNANRVVSSLIKKGYIVKTKCDGRKRFIKSTLPYIKADLTKSSTQTCRKRQDTNINITYISSNEDNIYIEPKFDFAKSLISAGVEKSVADDFMKVRKEKKAVNTKTAFDRLSSEIHKSGLSFNDAIRLCVERSWKGFEAKWLEEEVQKKKASYAPPQKESVLEHNTKVMQNIHKMFHPEDITTDEQ